MLRGQLGSRGEVEELHSPSRRWSRGGGKRTKPVKIRFQPAPRHQHQPSPETRLDGKSTAPRHSAPSRQASPRPAATAPSISLLESIPRGEPRGRGRRDAALVERGPRLGGRGRGLVVVVVLGGPPRGRRGAADVRPAVGGGAAGGRADAGAGARRALHPAAAASLRPRALALHLPGSPRLITGEYGKWISNLVSTEFRTKYRELDQE